MRLRARKNQALRAAQQWEVVDCDVLGRFEREKNLLLHMEGALGVSNSALNQGI